MSCMRRSGRLKDAPLCCYWAGHRAQEYKALSGERRHIWPVITRKGTTGQLDQRFSVLLVRLAPHSRWAPENSPENYLWLKLLLENRRKIWVSLYICSPGSRNPCFTHPQMKTASVLEVEEISGYCCDLLQTSVYMPCNDSAVEGEQKQAEVWHLACGRPKWIQISGYGLCWGICRKQVGIQRHEATTHFSDNYSRLSASWWPLRQRGELWLAQLKQRGN